MPRFRALVAAGGVALALSCKPPPSPSPAPAPTPSSPPASATVATTPSAPVARVATTASAPVAPVAAAAPAVHAVGGPEMLNVKLDDGGEAFVVVPIGATDRRPIVLGVHGAGDRHDWSCVEWQASTRKYPFIVCPRGVPTSKDFYSWGTHELLVKRAELALAWVRAHYTEHVADGPVMYGGWSQGGTLASSAIAARPGLFERVVMIEIGHTPLDAGVVASNLKRGGVTHAVVSCSSAPCRNKAREMRGSLGKAGIASETNDVGDRGHWFDEPVFQSLGPKVAWVTAGDSRWDGLRDLLALEAKATATEPRPR